MAMQADHDFSAWSLSAEDVLQELAVDSARGLEESEALMRRRTFGRNQLQAAERRNLVSILADQFKSIVIVLLMAAGVLALLFSGLAEAVAIFAVIVINATIGFLTEWRAVRSMEALRQFAKVDCVLLREGLVRRLAADELVPGDIVQAHRFASGRNGHAGSSEHDIQRYGHYPRVRTWCRYRHRHADRVWQDF